MHINPVQTRDGDIDDLVKNLNRLHSLAGKSCEDHTTRLAELTRSIDLNIPQIIDLLDELKKWRAAGSNQNSGDETSMCRAILEGYSDISAPEALATALEKAAHYFSEQHDIAITIKGLVTLPQGGHRATIEVHMTPLHLRLTPKVKGRDIELKRVHDHNYYHQRKIEEGYIKHLVFDHFSACKGAAPFALPEYFMINITDTTLLNHMIEKQFLNAREPQPEPEFSNVHHILVRTKSSNPEPALTPNPPHNSSAST